MNGTKNEISILKMKYSSWLIQTSIDLSCNDTLLNKIIADFQLETGGVKRCCSHY